MADIRHTTLSRRAAIAGGLAAGTVAMTVKGAVPLDPVIPLAETYLKAHAEYDDLEAQRKAGAISSVEFEKRADIVLDRAWSAYNRLSVMEARSVEGLAAQARALNREIAEYLLSGEDGPDINLIRNMTNVLNRMVPS